MLFLRLFPPTPGRSRNNGLNFLSCHLNIPFIFGNILENDHSQSCRAPEDGRCCFREEPKGELQETVMPRTQGCHHQLGCVPLWPLTSRSNRSGRLEADCGWMGRRPRIRGFILGPWALGDVSAVSSHPPARVMTSLCGGPEC